MSAQAPAVQQGRQATAGSGGEGNPGQADGSTRDTDLDRGADGDEGGAGGSARGGDSDEGASDKDLRQRLVTMEERLNQHGEFTRVLASLPNWPQIRSQIERALAGEDASPQGGGADTEYAEIDAIAEELLGDKADVLKKFVRMQDKRAEERARKAVRPLAQQAAESQASAKFLTGLRKAGLDSSIADHDDFIAFQREYVSENPFLRNALRQGGDETVAAAKLLGEEYKRRSKVPEQFQRERQRIADAQHQPESRGSRGGVTRAADGAVVVSRRGGPHAILDAIRKGASPDSIRVSEE